MNCNSTQLAALFIANRIALVRLVFRLQTCFVWRANNIHVRGEAVFVFVSSWSMYYENVLFGDYFLQRLSCDVEEKKELTPSFECARYTTIIIDTI